MFPILADSTVGERSCIVTHSGSGPNPSRQQSAHPHSINVDPSGRFAIVADLGQDKVFVYRLDAAAGTLSPNDPPFARVAPGAGPRHFAFHPDGRHAFVINEMAGSITAFDWDGEKGVLTPYDTVPILRRDYKGLNTSAEVVVSRSGRFVYGSNRGDDSIVVHAFDPATGKLTFVQRMADGVKVPRNYAIDPSGKWLVCANLTANTATVYRIDPESGRLALAGTIAVPRAALRAVPAELRASVLRIYSCPVYRARPYYNPSGAFQGRGQRLPGSSVAEQVTVNGNHGFSAISVHQCPRQFYTGIERVKLDIGPSVFRRNPAK